MGSPDFAVQCLNEIHMSSHEVLAVVTIPDKAQGRGKKTLPSPVKTAALKLGYEVLQPKSLKSADFKDQIETINPEIIVVVAFKILPESIFSIPVFGTVNIHASLLPKYRGAAPINHALLNGETHTGVTSFYITEEVDAGTILLQKEIEIMNDDNFSSLYDKLAKLGADLIVETLDKLDSEGIPFKVQNPEEVSPAPKITREICEIDWNNSGTRVINQIRAFALKPAAFTWYKGLQLKIKKAKFIPNSNFVSSENGQIVKIEKADISIKVNDGLISPEIIQLQGKKEMSIRDFLNGTQIELNTTLGNQ